MVVCVDALVLTKFGVKSYSIRRAIGTAQSIGQQGGFLDIKEDRLVEDKHGKDGLPPG